MAQGKVFSTGVEQFIDDSDLIVPSPSRKTSPQPKAVGLVKMF